MKVQVGFRTEEEQKALLEEEAKRQKRKLSSLLNIILDEWIKDNGLDKDDHK